MGKSDIWWGGVLMELGDRVVTRVTVEMLQQLEDSDLGATFKSLCGFENGQGCTDMARMGIIHCSPV